MVGSERPIADSERLKEAHTSYLGDLIASVGSRYFHNHSHAAKAIRKRLNKDYTKVGFASSHFLLGIRADLNVPG
jgi:hypothetical protein